MRSTATMVNDAPIDARAESPAPWINQKASSKAAAAAAARVAVTRRPIEPMPCDREYSDPETEFMHAMQEYKKSSGRMFPTWSEVLEVLGGLGYAKG
jgi:hypothetical protein